MKKAGGSRRLIAESWRSAPPIFPDAAANPTVQFHKLVEHQVNVVGRHRSLLMSSDLDQWCQQNRNASADYDRLYTQIIRKILAYLRGHFAWLLALLQQTKSSSPSLPDYGTLHPA